jgi:seryl-tRNA synthetase
MLDLRYIRANLDEVAERLAIKGFSFDKQQFLALDAQRKTSDVETQSLQAERKQASKKIGELVQSGVSVDEAKQQVGEALQRIDASLQALKERAALVDNEIQQFMYDIPNIPDTAVPAGSDETDNVEISRWGEPRQFSFEVADHVTLGSNLQGLDFDIASAMSGARFAVMKNQIAKLHRALAQFMLDEHTERHGYQEVNVPLIVNASALTGTSQLPKFEQDLFRLEGDAGYYLIPTAEVPVTNLLRDAIHSEEQLPLKFVAHTACFRSEAGSHGRDTRGLIRQHQFEKVELVQAVKPQNSEQALEELTGHAEAILQKLELPYRKVILCGGDLSFGSKKTYDLEVWLPAQNTYREISSCSNFGDFQSRRMLARWRNPKSNKPELLHTLNGSGLAVGRTLVAMLENGQQADGSIAIPIALQPYMKGLQCISASA